MASSNINTVVITGNLTKEPELRETGTGLPVCELRVACNAAIKKDGEWTTKPNYFQVNCWGGMAENCNKYLDKGSKVGVFGRLEWQKWESKEGGTNSRVVIVANQVEFLTAKGSRPKPTPEDESGEAEAVPTEAVEAEGETEEGKDEIPF